MDFRWACAFESQVDDSQGALPLQLRVHSCRFLARKTEYWLLLSSIFRVISLILARPASHPETQAPDTNSKAWQKKAARFEVSIHVFLAELRGFLSWLVCHALVMPLAQAYMKVPLRMLSCNGLRVCLAPCFLVEAQSSLPSVLPYRCLHIASSKL